MKNRNLISTEWDKIFLDGTSDGEMSNYAFPLYLFTDRLYQSLVETKTKDVLFMSREGQFLKKLFDRYIELRKENKIETEKINTYYFYGSRNSIMSASLKDINEEDFKFLFRFFSLMSAKSFMLSIGFTKEQIEQVGINLGKKIDRTHLNFKNSKVFKELKDNTIFLKIYNDNRLSQAKAFQKYLDSFKIDYQKEGLTFVDIGYHGTMQDLIYKFLGEKVKLTGYFIKNRSKSIETNKKIGLLSDSTNKNLFGQRINKYDAFNYEQVLRADHGRCAGYEIVKGEPKPIINKDYGDEQTYINLVKRVQDSIYNKFEKIFSLAIKEAYIDEVCVLGYYYLVKNKNKSEYKWLIDMQDNHHDDFGMVGYPGRMFARKLRKLVFVTRDKLFVCKNKNKIRKLKRVRNIRG